MKRGLLIAAGVAAALAPMADGFGKVADTQAQAWPAVTSVMKPWVRWWWMGSAVDPVSQDKELTRYQAAGVGGVEVTPIYGAKGWEDKYITYLSPKWMEMLNHSIATAKKLGMTTDMAQGTGWCFGGPTVSATDANAVIVSQTQDVQAGGTVTGTFDPKITQALVAYSADGKCVELTDKIGADGKVNWTADGTGAWKVYAISQKPSRQMVKRPAPGGTGYMLNPFYAGAISRYMNWFEGPFAASKPQINAMFQDSYEYQSQWSPDFFAQFEKLRGYRLQTELPALLGTAEDEHTARVKSDYRETISDMMTLDSMPVWVKWAHAHGYLTRYQAHGDPGNLLDLYAVADIPETEMIYKSRSILVSKFASSAAHVSGKNIIGSETGTWLAEHFTETLAEEKTEIDSLLLAGINHIIYHGTAYSPDEAAWPGWCFYASTEMNPRNAIWHDVGALNAYVARCQSILQSGTPDNDVLVYWPIYDRWNTAEGMVQNFDIKGATWFAPQAISKTAQELWDKGFAFDYISDRQLMGVDTKDGVIHAGKSKYRAIVAPACEVMPVETLKRLLTLAAEGAPVIFDGKLPTDVPGWGKLDERRAAFKAVLAGVKSSPTYAHGTVCVGDVVAALTAAGAEREAMADHAGVHFMRRAYDGGEHYFIANTGTDAVDGWVTLGTKAKAVEIMDPVTGKTGIAQVKTADGGSAEVYLQLAPGASTLVRTFSDKAETGTAWPMRDMTAAGTELKGTWSVKFIDGGPTLPAGFATQTLGSWTSATSGSDVQSFAGTARYTITFDAPAGLSGPCTIDLGDVRQSARVRLNGTALGTVFAAPYAVDAGVLKAKGNVLEVDVTSTSANRIRDLDIRGVQWKIFHDTNVVNVNYKPFNAAGWAVTDCGLLGPVMLKPIGVAKVGVASN